jgi:hypothetical protein
MNIISLESLKYNVYTKLYNFYYPVLAYVDVKIDQSLGTYIVQQGEEMRMDLVMMSIYDDASVLKSMDVLLFINNIDNPLNIMVGDIIYHPPLDVLDSYRYTFEPSSRAGENVRKALAVPNKTTKKDGNRRKFVENGYSLPPVVLDESKPPVRVEGDKIVIGGLNSN